MKRIITSFFFIVPIIASAQWGVSPNQAMVKGAVEQSLVIVCSSYKLQDSTGQRYGRNNRVEFSQGYTLGVVTDSGLIVSHSAVQPWLFDADFSRYRQSHNPILSAVSCRQIPDSAYTTLGLTADSLASSLLLRMPVDSIKNAPALPLYSDTTYKNGWLLWVYASDTLDKVGITTTTAVISAIETGDSAVSVSPPAVTGMIRDSLASQKVIGAVWVVPSFPKAGVVQFSVAGLAVKSDNGWLLAPLHIREKNSSVAPLQESTLDEELTPSPDQQQSQDKQTQGKKNKKTKKNKQS